MSLWHIILKILGEKQYLRVEAKPRIFIFTTALAARHTTPNHGLNIYITIGVRISHQKYPKNLKTQKKYFQLSTMTAHVLFVAKFELRQPKKR